MKDRAEPRRAIDLSAGWIEVMNMATSAKATHWFDSAADLEAAGVAHVLITVAAADGSTPREAGTKMIVTASEIFGTIGGGHLEYKATERARALLDAGDDEPGLVEERYSLGPSLGQCCGGGATLMFERRRAADAPSDWTTGLAACRNGGVLSVLVTSAEAATANGGRRKMLVSAVTVWDTLGDEPLDRAAVDYARRMFLAGPQSPETAGPQLVEIGSDAGKARLYFEPIPTDDLTIAIFGAGHVGRALVSALAGLPCRVVWIDSRTDAFPDDLPANVTALESDTPEYEVDELPRDSYCLVMTHSHPLDLKLSERILRRGDCRYFGLIGSATKRARFEKRLLQKGLSADTIGRMVCPIGIGGITSKHPSAIAIAVVAQILQRHEAAAADDLDVVDAVRSA